MKEGVIFKQMEREGGIHEVRAIGIQGESEKK